jgi:hypothetical protein
MLVELANFYMQQHLFESTYKRGKQWKYKTTKKKKKKKKNKQEQQAQPTQAASGKAQSLCRSSDD